MIWHQSGAKGPNAREPIMQQIQQIVTIGRNTFYQSIRQPIFMLLVLGAALVLILNTFLSAYTLDDDNRMLMDVGLSTLFLVGMLLAAFTSTGVVSDEVENRTVLTVVSKPVSRPVFILGKYAGVASAISVGVSIVAVVFLFTIRHKVMQYAVDKWDFPVLALGFGAALLSLVVATAGNYLYNWQFPSTFVLWLAGSEIAAYLLVLVISPEWKFQPITAEFTKDKSQLDQLLVVMLLVYEAVLIITAVALTASTRLGQVLTLAICFGVFILGMLSESLFGGFLASFDAGRYSNGILAAGLWTIAKVFYTITPNLQFLWQSDALLNYIPVTAKHVATVSLYALLQITAVLGLSVALFQTREVG